MATTRICRSTDTSAPVLTGQADSLNALLKACLVNGYGTNAPLGWTNPYNDTTNKIAVFKQGTGSSQRYLRVNDNGPNGTSTFKEARVVGFEASAGAFYTDGTAAFPTSVQESRTGVTGDNTGTTSGLVWRKSATADATARPWILIGNETMFYLFMQTGDSGTLYLAYAFGDIYSYKTGDLYRAYITGRETENSASGTNADFAALCAFNTTVAANFMPRSYTAVGSSTLVGKHTDVAGIGMQVTLSGATGIPYPNPADGGLLLARIYIHEASTAKRGFLPGVWNCLHQYPLVNGDTFSGSGGLAGRTFECVQLFVNGTSSQVFIETSNTWDVSA